MTPWATAQLSATIAASFATVFMLRAVPLLAAGIFSLLSASIAAEMNAQSSYQPRAPAARQGLGRDGLFSSRRKRWPPAFDNHGTQPSLLPEER